VFTNAFSAVIKDCELRTLYPSGVFSVFLFGPCVLLLLLKQACMEKDNFTYQIHRCDWIQYDWWQIHKPMTIIS